MPRSKRRKGVKKSNLKAKRFLNTGTDSGVIKRYYDPGKNPMPRNLAKGNPQALDAIRHRQSRG